MSQLKFTIIALFVVLFSFSQQKKNVLFIFADDFAYDCIASHGNKEVKTPNLDKLTAMGTHFTHAYNSGSWSGAVCIASRTQMMTGQYVWGAASVWAGNPSAQKPEVKSALGASAGKSKGANGKGKKGKKKKGAKSAKAKKNPHSDGGRSAGLSINKGTLAAYVNKGMMWPQIMQKAGYNTYYSGKWHTGGKDIANSSWKNTVHIRPGMPKQQNIRYKRTFNEGKKSNWSPSDKSLGGYWQGGKHWSEVLADDGINLLDQAKESGKPFMMTLAFNAPHDPRQAPKEYQQMYPYGKIEVPADFMEEYPYQNGSRRIRDEKLLPFPRTKYAVQVNRSEYYALISHTDTQIGKILDHLKKTGLDKNTIIVFTADHGLAVGHHGLCGKQNMYDHSIRVPWMIAGPGIPKGKKVDTPIYLQDVVSTSIEIAGAEVPSYYDFKSVLPLLDGKGDSNATVYSSYTNFQRMVCNKEFKLIVYPQSNIELLYDLKNDPMEMKDLAKDSKYAKDLAKMKSLLAAKMKEFNDPMDITNPVASYPYQGAPGAH